MSDESFELKIRLIGEAETGWYNELMAAHHSYWVLAAWGSRETWAAGPLRVVTGRRWWRSVLPVRRPAP